MRRLRAEQLDEVDAVVNEHWSIEPLGGGHFELDDPHGGAHVLRPPLVGLALPTVPPER